MSQSVTAVTKGLSEDATQKEPERHCYDQRVKFRTGPPYEGPVNKKAYVSTHLALKGSHQALQHSYS